MGLRPGRAGKGEEAGAGRGLGGAGGRAQPPLRPPPASGPRPPGRAHGDRRAEAVRALPASASQLGVRCSPRGPRIRPPGTRGAEGSTPAPPSAPPTRPETSAWQRPLPAHCQRPTSSRTGSGGRKESGLPRAQPRGDRPPCRAPRPSAPPGPTGQRAPVTPRPFRAPSPRPRSRASPFAPPP